MEGAFSPSKETCAAREQTDNGGPRWENKSHWIFKELFLGSETEQL